MRPEETEEGGERRGWDGVQGFPSRPVDQKSRKCDVERAATDGEKIFFSWHLEILIINFFIFLFFFLETSSLFPRG